MVSCVETRYLEKLGLITAVGYDKSENEEIKGSLVLYQFNPTQQDVEKILTTKAKTSKGIRLSQNLETDHKLASGQLRVAIYGSELASEGIAHLVDTLERDASIGNMVYLAISHSTAEEILTYEMKERPSNMGTYLYNLLRQNLESELLVPPTLQEFITDYGSVGKDPVLPILTASEGKVGVGGIALFHGDKFAKEIDNEKIFYIRSLIEEYKLGSLEVEIPLDKFDSFLLNTNHYQEEMEEKKQKLYITLDSIKSNHKIKAKKQKKPEFTITLNIEARLLEMSEELKLSDPKILNLLEKEISIFLEKNLKETIDLLQREGTDPIGFGMEYKTIRGHQDLTNEKWQTLYKEASFKINVKNKIIRTGVID